MLRGLRLVKQGQRPANICLSQHLWRRCSTATIKVVELSSDSHIAKAIASDKLSVLDFTAKWCGPCKMMAPEYEKMSKEFPQASFYKIDIDNPDVQTSVSKHDISGVPTFKLLRNGSVVAELTGADKQALRKYLQLHAK
ncbi:hypothetical protein ABBQ38_002649 [Trebouxia sp. C0009 RCD-2024]